MKKQKMIIGGSVIIALIIIASITYALFTATEQDSATIDIGEINVVLEEDWPENVSEFGIERSQKKVWGESTGDKKAYVRMKFVPVVQYFVQEKDNEQNVISEEWKTAPIAQEDINISLSNDENWILQGDYYYYKKILNPGETTDKIDLSWEVYEMPSVVAGYQDDDGKGIRTDVRVILEYAQATNDAWKEIFQIENLPGGVERQEVE